jgi:tRNA U34 5-methylaminomethyl-2-thiouridine-forming methyltransferase MnmC
LNALLTAVRCIEGERVVSYTAIEKYPLPEDIINLLNYSQFAGKEGIDIFKLIHSASWNKYVPVHRRFNIRKIEADFTSAPLSGCYDLIYFDAFGPDKQPEMWSADIFEAIGSVTVKNGILITYSAKGDVRRNLKSCGFDVALLPGPPGKRQIIRAVKI